MRPFLALALPAMVLSASAFAQSSVTLYGSIDNGITYVNNVAGSSSIRMQDGANKSNTLGFLGSEDLGGGQKALFKLENGFSANTGALGQGGLMFGKQAYVGLSDNRIGQVTLGRQYDFTVVLEHYLPCLQCGLFVVENADFDRISGDRLNNSVQFQSRDFGGLKIGTMYAFAQNATGSTNSGRAYSFMAEYTNGPFGAIAVATDINGAPVLASLLGTRSFLGVPVGPPGSVTVVDNQRILGAGVSYSFGALRTSAVYANTRLSNHDVASTDQILYVGAEYRITPSLLLSSGLSADRFEGSGWYSADAGIDYSLSKRTDVYLDGKYQTATGPGTRSSIALTAPSSTDKQVLARVGLRHLF